MDILVVDDEELIVELVQHALSIKGYTVRSAGCGTEALDVLREGPADLVISDIRMPHMDGLELALRVRQEFPTTQIILMTGYFSEFSQSSADAIGVVEIVKKPFRTSQIVSLVEQVAASNSVTPS
ncbi:MAG TPA: response regulator [candidate division Zixibacteria bacterium]|jgi:CheY-like chemotaxis protein